MPALKFLSLFLVGFAFVLASGDLGVTTRSIKCYVTARSYSRKSWFVLLECGSI